MNVLGVIDNDQSELHAKGQGQKAKVKFTEVKTQLNRFRAVSSLNLHLMMKWCIKLDVA